MDFDPKVPFLSSAVRGIHLSDWELRPPRYTQLFRGVWIDSTIPLDTEQWGIDLDRREWMDAHDWRLLVNRSGDIYSTPARTLRRAADTMRARGMVVPPLSDEWRRHFPSRPWDESLPA